LRHVTHVTECIEWHRRDRSSYLLKELPSGICLWTPCLVEKVPLISRSDNPIPGRLPFPKSRFTTLPWLAGLSSLLIPTSGKEWYPLANLHEQSLGFETAYPRSSLLLLKHNHQNSNIATLRIDDMLLCEGTSYISRRRTSSMALTIQPTVTR